MYATVSEMFKTEREFVRWLQTLPSPKASRARLGIGDDAALVRAGGGRDFILTTDLSIEGVHFQRRLHPARAVGPSRPGPIAQRHCRDGRRSALRLALRCLYAGHHARLDEEFFQGLLGLASRYNVEVIGGDTAVVGRVGHDGCHGGG